ncbi:FtsX-like permease family protein [Thalassospira sp.]|uniref:ABC transporter permease n=1 Tax=Thalassospira sp. TaxID=1912094 RepID=UPI001B15ABCF|nr:FtsX-like permease family protein [Thalassospira sp.]MBO6808054.1 FtsX-like permease family protein [Thalassospira sp.]MBO6839573.1 FtsX-like permease family protein [Thalassospira sp.]
MSRPTSALFKSLYVPTSLRIALRELRKPGAGITTLFATLVFAVTILVLTVSLTQSVRDGLRQSAQQTIGGDISLRLFHRAPTTDEVAFLETLGTLGVSIEQRVMIRPSNDQPPVLSELKAVDATYPLFGNLGLSPDIPLRDAIQNKDGLPGIVVGPELLEDTGLAVGDKLDLGGHSYQIRASIAAEPERKFRLFSLGPRVIVALEHYRKSPLLAPGKQVYWYLRLKLPQDSRQTPQQVIADIEARFPDSGWRIVNAADGVPGLERIGDFASAFVSLIGIAIFAIATSAIRNALRADLAARRSRFATLRSLGARSRDIARSVIWQLGLVTGVAILIAVFLTMLIGTAIGPLIGETLGFDVHPDFKDGPLITAFVFGFVALVTIKPVRDACLTSPACLFRHQSPAEAKHRSTRLSLLQAFLALGLIAIASTLIDLDWVAHVLLGVLITCQGLFVILGQAVRLLAGKLATIHMLSPTLRLALRNIARPSAPTVTITASFGLAMTCLCAVLLFGALAGQHLKSILPTQTPDVVFFDIPPAEQDAVRTSIQNNAAVTSVIQMPFLHGRVTHLNGRPLTHADVPRRYHWFLRGDRGMSWTDLPTPDMRQNPVKTGQWWKPDSLNENLVSLDAGAARAIGITLGDQLTLNILGQSHVVEVANLRQIDWTRLGLDFPIVLSPMDPAFDHGVISAIDLKEGVGTKAAITPTLDTYPDIPVIFINQVLLKLTRLFDGVITGLIGLTTLATIGAAFVIVCGLIALRQQQTATLAMLRALGLRPGQITRTGALETGLMIATGGMVGVTAGSTIALVAAQSISPINLGQVADVAGPMAAITFGFILVIGFGGGWILQAASLRAQSGWRG